MEQCRQELETVPLTQPQRIIELTGLMTALAKSLKELKYSHDSFYKR